MKEIFDFNITNILNSFITGILVYIFLIIYIRILGKRSTSELNSFDWIITVSLGSIFATTVLDKNISLFDGGITIFILLVLQYVTTKIMKNSLRFQKLVKSSPKLLLYKGEFLEENLKNERILKAEIYAAVRQKGLKSIKDIYAIVLETNSKISVISNENPQDVGFSLRYVEGLPKELKEVLEKSEKDKKNNAKS